MVSDINKEVTQEQLNRLTQEKLKDERDKYRNVANDVKSVLESLIHGLETFVLIFRFLLYVGSVALAWFYLKDRVLAVGIVSSLTVAHLLIEFKEWLRTKKEKLTKRSWS